MKMIRATDLWKHEQQRKTINMQAMKPVLSNLFSQIKTHAATNHDAPYLAFEVPSFVFGYPLFDHREAIQYVSETLQEQGFQVWNVGPATLLICWIQPPAGQRTVRAPPRSGPGYRPFVYDDSSMAFLRQKMN